MKEDRVNLFIKYLHDELDNEARLDFEKKLQTPDFAKDFEEFQKISKLCSTVGQERSSIGSSVSKAVMHEIEEGTKKKHWTFIPNFLRLAPIAGLALLLVFWVASPLREGSMQGYTPNFSEAGGVDNPSGSVSQNQGLDNYPRSDSSDLAEYNSERIDMPIARFFIFIEGGLGALLMLLSIAFTLIFLAIGLIQKNKAMIAPIVLCIALGSTLFFLRSFATTFFNTDSAFSNSE